MHGECTYTQRLPNPCLIGNPCQYISPFDRRRRFRVQLPIDHLANVCAVLARILGLRWFSSPPYHRETTTWRGMIATHGPLSRTGSGLGLFKCHCNAPGAEHGGRSRRSPSVRLSCLPALPAPALRLPAHRCADRPPYQRLIVRKPSGSRQACRTVPRPFPGKCGLGGRTKMCLSTALLSPNNPAIFIDSAKDTHRGNRHVHTDARSNVRPGPRR